MNFLEMMVNLEKGKKVRHKNWRDDDYMTFTKQDGIVKNFKDKIANLEHFVNHMYEDCWEFYKDTVTFDKVPIGEKFGFNDGSGWAIKVKRFNGTDCVIYNKGNYIGGLMRAKDVVIYPYSE